ncbi:uncharacterized protein LOC135498317 [Lineus longissimus]|uniref:uncharacterized protein LOC135498317 n=1 Tax=Lineus longissimus TaxID=88925 RepID=UPI00315DDE81
MATHKTRYGRQIRPTAKALDTAWKVLETPKKDVRIQIDNEFDEPDTLAVPDGSQPREHSSSSERATCNSVELKKAELRLRYETKCAELETEQIELETRKLNIQKRLETARASYDLKELELNSKSDSVSMMTIDECFELHENVYKADAKVQPPVLRSATKVDSWIQDPHHENNCRSNHEQQEVYKPPAPFQSNVQNPPFFVHYGPGLPEFKIEVFSGKPADWPEWFLSFKNLIHDNPALTDGQRLGYLKTYLGQEPRSKVFGLLLDAKDYPKAMTELRDRYGNPALVIDGFIRKVRQWPKLRGICDLGTFFTNVSQLIQMFKAMGYEADLQAKGLLCDLTSKIPDSMQESWGNWVVKKGEGNPTVELFYQWLKSKENALRFTSLSSNPPCYQSIDKSKKGHEVKKTVTTLTTPYTQVKKYCVFCNGEHWLDSCAKFSRKTPSERLAWFKEKGRCFLCTKTTHRSSGCFLKIRCKVKDCGKSHATILHEAFLAPKLAQSSFSSDHTKAGVPKEGSKPDVHSVGVGFMKKGKSVVYLQTLPVRIHTPSGQVVDTYGLLDSGSQATLIQEDFAKSIGLKGPSSKLRVCGVGGKLSEQQSKCLSFWLSDPKNDSKPLIRVKEAWTFSEPFSLSVHAGNNADFSSWPHVQHLNLEHAPDSLDIKVLIGVNVTKAHTQLEVREGPVDLPIAVHTPLGWTVMGVDRTQPDSSGNEHDVSVNNFLINKITDLEQSVERFWKTESFGTLDATDVPYSMEDKRAQDALDTTTRITENGHYEVSMLWSKPPDLVDNKPQAERRFEQLQRKLNNNPTFRDKYRDVINKYISKGFARKLSPEEVSQSSDRTHYLPHHGVVNPKKPDKLRVVFDAAAVYAGSSLNDHLLVGPDLLNNLIGILMRFRCGPIAISADVESMFHMVLVPKDDRDALRFLWKDDLESDDPPDVYQMVVHIFGAKSSPCCANYCLRRCALDHIDKFSPLVIDTVLHNFYVDDMLKALYKCTIEEAIDLVVELIKITASGGFKLTAWASNCPEILSALKDLDDSLGISTVVDLNLDGTHSRRTLGINCDMKSDVFCFESIVIQNVCTKRGIMSKISSVFDPLGLLSPFVLRAKLIMKSLWEKGYGWDDIVSDADSSDWTRWCEELSELPGLHIPRCYWPCEFVPETFVLHTFCDASEFAFAACSYLFVSSESGELYGSLVMSKTKVAPLKDRCLTMPRLELQGLALRPGIEPGSPA